MNYDLWVDYTTVLQDLLINEISFPVFEDPSLYDAAYVPEETKGLVVWNYSPTLLKENKIDALNRVDFYIKPVSARTPISGYSGEMYYAINIETHRDVDLTGTRCRYLAQEIVNAHKEAKRDGRFPVSNTMFTYTPVVYDIQEPQPLVYQPYNRGAVLMKLVFLSCEIN